MSDRVTIAIADGVADVRLNRPDKLNALDTEMFVALVEAGDALRADPSVRAVVLSGEGRGFCAGLDLGSFEAMASGDFGSGAGADLGARPPGRITNLGQQACYTWFEMPAPVIAAVHGPCLGGGFQLAIACDLRIVAPDVKMGLLEVRWGLAPDMTGTQLLPGLVGLDAAKELTFTGRMVDGAEALRLGLATRVADDPRPEALALAAEIAAKNPHAIKGAKALLNLAGTVSLEDGFLAESRTIASLIGSPNQTEAVTAYFEKRAPVFTD